MPATVLPASRVRIRQVAEIGGVLTGPGRAAADDQGIEPGGIDILDGHVRRDLHAARGGDGLAAGRREMGVDAVIAVGGGVEQGGFPIGETGRQDGDDGGHGWLLMCCCGEV